VTWAEGSPALPPGGKMAVLQGDPKKEGRFTLRLKLPAGYKVPPHTHPDTETVTVLSGTLHASMGDTFDPSKTKAMPAGSFLALPAKSPHFVHTKEETIIQVTATGPWTITYVNPADDPRNKAK
jgi:quercetin dioxygenase-like cupin family protein